MSVDTDQTQAEVEAEATEIETGMEIVPVETQHAALIPAATPAQYIEKVTEIANALASIIRDQKLFKRIGNKNHVEVEGWTTLGALMGVFGESIYAVPDGEPEWIEIDGVKGVKATMKAVTASGRVVGGGTGYCMRNESKWRTADFYAMAGMAQTRATSRALRQPLGFIVKLAGYEATPSAEFDGGEPAAPAEPNPDELAKHAALLDRVREGMKQLEPLPQWTEGAILRQAKLLWNSEGETLSDLSAQNLEAILGAMADAGVTV